MNIEIKGVHNYHVSDKTEEYLQKKIKRLNHASEQIEDIHFSVERENNGEYKVCTDIHFHWSSMHHISVINRDLYKGIDLLFDKIETKVDKEVGKKQDHH